VSICILIRHGLTDVVGNSLCGWTPGVHLNEQGRAQAEALPGRLAGAPIAAIYSSPLERALETAAPLSKRLGIKVETSKALGEIDFGHWTGRSFESLNDDPEWRRFNNYRSGTKIPGGEWIGDAQLRVVRELEELRGRHPSETVAVFSHGDILRSALAYYLGVSIDLAHRIEISPVSVNIVELNEYGPRILRLNDTAVWP
jgi:probable phosphomutase (TIGR03848 family)